MDREVQAPQQARSRQTVECLVEAATRLLGEKGPEVTTNDIASRAGVGVATLYRYFPDKWVLFDACAEVHYARLASERDAIFAELESRPLLPFAPEIVERMSAIEDERPGMSTAVERIRRMGRRVAALDRFEAETKDLFVDWVARHHPTPGGASTRAASMFIHACMAAMGQTLASHGGRPGEVLREIAEMMEGGLERLVGGSDAGSTTP